MEAMRKEIVRLNEIIGKGCMDGKAQIDDKKKDEPKGPQYKKGRYPLIKHGLDHTKVAKINGRKIVNGYECVQFERNDRISTDQPTQPTVVQQPRALVPRSSSAAVKGGSATPNKNGKATHSVPDQTKPMKKVSQQKQVSQKSKESIWGTMNKYAFQLKAHAPRQSLTSCFVLKNNSSGNVVAKYVGKETNVYRNTSIWVPKILVTNMQGPKSSQGPKSRN